MKYITTIFALILFATGLPAQIPTNIGVQILKAEDARRYDKTLEDLMSSQNVDVRTRAVLAAGRIGREEAIQKLSALLTNDPSESVRVMAAFALGEVESIKAADAILNELQKPARSKGTLTARLVEAAGKITAANPKDPKSAELGKAIIEAVEFENAKRSAPTTEIIRLGMTAILRAKPVGGEETARKFLRYSDPNIVADALNTLARLRAKNVNAEARNLLIHTDPIVRANAARVLGAAEDKTAVDQLLKTATEDTDSRVRVAAIRSLNNFKDEKVAVRLFEYLKTLLVIIHKSKSAQIKEKSEILELVTVLGRLWQSADKVEFANTIDEFRWLSNGGSPEVEIAMSKISPNNYIKSIDRIVISGVPMNLLKVPLPQRYVTWQKIVSVSQGLAELPASAENKAGAERFLRQRLRIMSSIRNINEMSAPDVLRSYSKFKPSDLNPILLNWLSNVDPLNRATATELLSNQPKSNENLEALKSSFSKAFVTDKNYNDAQLAIMDALYKLDKREAVGSLLVALNAPDYLVRKKAFELLADKDLQKDFPGIPTSLEIARSKHKDQVLPYSPAFGTKLGQVLNSEADYRRALSRKNGSVKAVVTTEKGAFTIEFYPEEAPLTVDNFIKLANAKYFNGVEVHRVVPNFVMQDGDPRGDGNGGPGWSIRCEINMIAYERGAVGMALSGKDTGGSQWFVTHSPQPHLDGGYTVFGRVNDEGMKVVDNIVRGDKILNVKIVESRLPQRPQRSPRNGK